MVRWQFGRVKKTPGFLKMPNYYCCTGWVYHPGRQKRKASSRQLQTDHSSLPMALMCKHSSIDLVQTVFILKQNAEKSLSVSVSFNVLISKTLVNFLVL